MIVCPIVILAIENEEDRFFMQQLYDEYYRSMCAQAYSVLGERQYIDDVISEALIALIDKIQILAQMKRPVLHAYIVSTIRNTSVNFIKRQCRQRNHTVPDPESILETLECSEADPDTPLLIEEDVTHMQKAILKLPDYERRVLQMKYFQDLDNGEIARQLGIKPDSVRKFLLRARRHTLEIMESEDK